ncbi:hypothetical protein [Kineosporia sp. NBRC 101731]|uniref:hypothetical protein n=1 Tax=Kineosporia sp. NBRC 101731 TaxID=3032199 RepID=UPI0024A0709F|nr:hypothetical protein [Kineosporia sp. NBRC 101731]GLY32144.1 hypothetical protein Kisp02_55090 [Kineosporia sp. NBRC 101731]
MSTDPHGTDITSLVPMNLDPEPDDYREHEVAGADEVTAPEADLTGDPVAVDKDVEIEFDDAADLALLEKMGDRADAED